MGRVINTHLPSASSFNGVFSPVEDMVVKGKESVACGSKQVTSHATLPFGARTQRLSRAPLINPTPRKTVVPSMCVTTRYHPCTSDYLALCLYPLPSMTVVPPSPSSSATDGGMKTPGMAEVKSRVPWDLKRGRFN